MAEAPVSQSALQDTLVGSLFNKPVINNALNMNNAVPYDEISDIILTTINHLIDVLHKHCGPEAGYCMVSTGTGHGVFEPNLFIKDGIKIVNSLEYTSPIQNYIKNLIAYIGQRVDAAAKDGTTSSMLIACYCLKYLIENKAEYHRLGYDTTFWTNCFTVFYDELIDYLTTVYGTTINTVNGVVTDPELVRLISYNQAMSSSNGMVELAEAVAELFSATPPELWQYVVTSQSTIERPKLFEVVYDEYHYRLSVNVQTSNIYNTHLNTLYEGKDVLVLPIADGLVDGSMVLDKVLGYLRTVPETQSCIVLCTNADSQLIRVIEQINTQRVAPIILGSVISSVHSYSENNEWYLLALSAIAGKYNYADYKEYSQYILPDIRRHVLTVPKVVFDGIDMYFYDIYKEKRSSNFHPYYLSPKKFKPYTDLLNSFRMLITREMERHHPKEGRIMTLQLLIYQMVCNHTCKLVIGGDTHDNVAAVSIVQDVVGATISSLTNGVLVGGILHFYRALCDVEDKLLAGMTDDATDMSNKVKGICWVYLNCLRYAVSSIIDEIYGTKLVLDVPLSKTEYINAKSVITAIRSTTPEDTELNLPFTVRPIFYTDFSFFKSLKKDKTDKEDNTVSYIRSLISDTSGNINIAEHVRSLDTVKSQEYAPMQPITVYKELLRRFKELILKVFLTESIVVPNSVYIPQYWLRQNRE